jgi:hypothetical protein
MERICTEFQTLTPFDGRIYLFVDTNLHVIVRDSAWIRSSYNTEVADSQLVDNEKERGKVYLQQEMKIEEMRQREMFILLEAGFSIIKRTLGNVSTIYREKLQVVRRFSLVSVFNRFPSVTMLRNVSRRHQRALWERKSKEIAPGEFPLLVYPASQRSSRLIQQYLACIYSVRTSP